jgi:hypothetical protein
MSVRDVDVKEVLCDSCKESTIVYNRDQLDLSFIDFITALGWAIDDGQNIPVCYCKRCREPFEYPSGRIDLRRYV